MGARWAWDAICNCCDDSFSGFSGGPDDCPSCGSDDVEETPSFDRLPDPMDLPEKDDCVFCLGAKGGAKGNENMFAGHPVCDGCTRLLLDIAVQVTD